MAQKSKWSLWVHWPFIQKYAASNAVGKYENGLSYWSVALKSDMSLILNVSFVELFVAVPLYEFSLVLKSFGFLSRINLYK